MTQKHSYATKYYFPWTNIRIELLTNCTFLLIYELETFRMVPILETDQKFEMLDRHI